MSKNITVTVSDELWLRLQLLGKELNKSEVVSEALERALKVKASERGAQRGTADLFKQLTVKPAEIVSTLTASGGVLPLTGEAETELVQVAGEDPALRAAYLNGYTAGTITAWQQVQASTAPQVARVTQQALDYSDQLERDGVKAIKRLQDEGETERTSGKAKPSAAGA